MPVPKNVSGLFVRFPRSPFNACIPWIIPRTHLRYWPAITTRSSPTCREVTRLQSDHMERELSRRERLGLRLHLLLCRWCRRYGQHVRWLRHSIQEHPEDLAEAQPQCLSPEARERIKRVLKQEG